MCNPRLAMLVMAFVLMALAGFASSPAGAQMADPPYWASLRSEDVNMRVGPSTAYPIEWVYHRPGLPVKVVRVNEGWRLVEDHEGVRGWVAARLLSRARHAVVVGKGRAALREVAEPSARVRWYAEPGVVGRLGDCDQGWCNLDVGGHAGWVEQDRLWGAGPP